MKKALCLMIVGLMVTAANAGVTAEWVKTVGAVNDVFVLQVIGNTEGLALSGLDIKVVGSGFVRTSGVVFNIELFGEKTVFNMDPEYLTVSKQKVSATELTGAAVYTGESGLSMGMTPALLSIVVPTGTIGDPLTQLTVTASASAVPMVRPGSNPSVPLTIVPEPATMSLLGVGALALIRRRRK